MAEHSAVNRRVVGSSPTWGAKKWCMGSKNPIHHFFFHRRTRTAAVVNASAVRWQSRRAPSPQPSFDALPGEPRKIVHFVDEMHDYFVHSGQYGQAKPLKMIAKRNFFQTPFFQETCNLPQIVYECANQGLKPVAQSKGLLYSMQIYFL